MDKELNFQEQAFVSLYLQSFNARGSAINAGYAETVAHTHAHTWVSLTTCPPNKRHVYNAVQKEIEKRYGSQLPDSDWVLKRAKLLADFNINKFLKVDDLGNAVYDFSEASDDDWYCITEYTVENITKGRGQDAYDVERVKIKTSCKLRAIELVGKHVSIQAFRDQVDIGGTLQQVHMSADEYKKARGEMLAGDDC